jgi:hypothetical protein
MTPRLTFHPWTLGGVGRYVRWWLGSVWRSRGAQPRQGR